MTDEGDHRNFNEKTHPYICLYFSPVVVRPFVARQIVGAPAATAVAGS